MYHQLPEDKRFYVLRVISGKEVKTKEMLDREKERLSFVRRVFRGFGYRRVMIQRSGKKKNC